jgi:transposase InsO family protein
VCLDVFSKHVKLYPLKAATTRSCLNKLINHYFLEAIKPKVILSDNGTQFQSPLWKRAMQENDVQVRYLAIWHPQSNPCERFMKEIPKFCRIYCYQNHKKWAELTPHVKAWLIWSLVCNECTQNQRYNVSSINNKLSLHSVCANTIV